MGAAATVYDAIAKPTKSNWKKHSSVMLVALGFCAESGVLLAQIRVAHIVEGVSVSDAKTLQVRISEIFM